VQYTLSLHDALPIFSQEIEKAYDDEDEAMMIRLIRIRDALWT
jgi:hypothetical protein